MNNLPLVIYHGNCADGFTSAWLANMAYAEAHPKIAGSVPHTWVVDHHAGFYGDPPPDVRGRTVYILDFSYPAEVLVEMAKQAASIIVIDHHETAVRALEGARLPDNVNLHLDMSRSGAYLTSLYFWPSREPSLMVKLVDDRDRWQFRDTRSRPFAAGLFSRLFTVEEWNAASENVEEVVAEGLAIERKHHKDIEELLAQTAFLGRHSSLDSSLRVAVANLPYTLASDACHKMLEQFPLADFAATYFINNKYEYVFSLRSRPDGPNVAKIAEEFGGGGHAHASGFRSSFNPFE